MRSLVKSAGFKSAVVKSLLLSMFAFLAVAVDVLPAHAVDPVPATYDTTAISQFILDGKTAFQSVIAIIAAAVLTVMLTGTSFTKAMSWLKRVFKAS